MIGYQDPKMGNQRRKALASYLKGQSQSRASAADAMRGVNTSALGGRSSGAGTPFQRGGGKASPEKFGFAGMKPSLKTLLGLIGTTMGQGGRIPSFNIFSPDTPVGGLQWGGPIDPNPSPSPSTGGLTYPELTPGLSFAGPWYPGGSDFQYNWKGTSPAPGFDPTQWPTLGGFYNPYGGGAGGGFTSPQKPILGDYRYGDEFLFGGF